MSPSDVSNTTTTTTVDPLPPALVKREASEETSDATADATVSVGSSSPDNTTSEVNNASSPPSTPSSRKSVRFSQVQIREHGVTLGDHPGTTLGPPISIHWQHHAEHTLDVNDYENAWTSPKRRGRELLMPGPMREQLLLTNDQHTLKEIRLAERQASRIRNSRQVAVGMQDMEHLEAAWQSAVRKLKRWTKNKTDLEPAEAWIHERKKLTRQAAKNTDRLNQSTNGRIQKTTTTTIRNQPNTSSSTTVLQSKQQSSSKMKRSHSLPPQSQGRPMMYLDQEDDGSS